MVNRRVFGGLLGAGLIGLVAFPPQRPVRAAAPPPYPREVAVGHSTPSWSPDDRLIAYMTLGSGPGTIFTVSASAGEPVRIFDDDHHYATPAWSPDGTRLAFASDRSGPWTIWTSTPGGSDLRPVTPGQFAQVFAPSWSPDGARIAYSAIGPSGPSTMTVPSQGGTPTRFADGWRPRWSPDGTLVAVTGRFTESGREFEAVVVCSADGARSRRLQSTIAPFHTPHLAADWSPDGRHLVVPRRSGSRSELLSVDVASDTTTTLASIEGYAFDPAWSHRGDRIAYSSVASDHPAEIHVVPASDGTPVALTHQPRGVRARLVEYPGDGGLRIPAWLYEAPPREGRHPALVWVHGGGPGEGRADDEYDAPIQYFAQQGYEILAPNYRGSVGYGDAIAAVSRPGDVVSDLAAAGQYLRGLPLVDPARVGIIGFSAGGFWTALTVASAPASFAAAADFFGPTDLVEFHRSTPTAGPLLERLLGPLDRHEEAYRDASPIARVDRVSVPVLVVHGDADRVIPLAQSVRFVEALRAAGKTVRFVQIPKAGHGFEGTDAATAFEAAADFFDTHLRH